ncbi:MAG TPA: sulfotransferase [Gammaproteobacteria bacterium]|nr:sulfotransferase [Gammaproteobacteria bacterium]
MELGKLLDNEGDYANAFDRMTLAKKKIRTWHQIKGQDLADYRNEIERYKNVFSGQSISSRDDGSFECLPEGIVFLVGFPRSGTTLTEQILGSCPDFIITDELPILSRITEDIGSVIGRPFTYPDDVASLSRNDIQMLRSTYWHRMEESLRGVSLKGKYLLDKLPLNLRHLGLIERLFPEARVLVALRDPRDVCISCYMQAFSLNPAMAQFLGIEDTAEFYAVVMGLWLHYRGVLNIKVLETRYEDIVDDLEGTARRILAFVGVEWEPEVMRFYESARKRHIHTPSYESVVQPIYRKSIGRWKRYKKQIAPIIPVLEPFLCEFGYSDVTYAEE